MEKGFTVRELTIRGWKRREDLDFRDDGTKFKAFEYENGLIATYTKADGEYYLSLRLDYLDGLVYEEYSKLEHYILADEFNGVMEIDADKVCENAKILMEEYNSKVAEVDKHEVDMERLVNAAEEELTLVYRVLAESNIGIDDLEGFAEYELRRLRDYRKTIKSQVESLLSRLEAAEYTKKELRNLEYRLDKCGYLTISEKDSYYIKEIRRIVSKAKVGE